MKHYANDVFATFRKFLQSFASVCNILILIYCSIYFILFYMCGQLYACFEWCKGLFTSPRQNWETVYFGRVDFHAMHCNVTSARIH